MPVVALGFVDGYRRRVSELWIDIGSAAEKNFPGKNFEGNSEISAGPVSGVLSWLIIDYKY